MKKEKTITKEQHAELVHFSKALRTQWDQTKLLIERDLEGLPGAAPLRPEVRAYLEQMKAYLTTVDVDVTSFMVNVTATPEFNCLGSGGCFGTYGTLTGCLGSFGSAGTFGSSGVVKEEL